MFPVNQPVRMTGLRVVPEPVLDGYGVPFDPVRHREFVLNPQPVAEFAPSVPDLPVYEGEGCKDKPAGHYEKGSGI